MEKAMTWRLASTIADMTKPALPPSQVADKYIVRLPDGMRERLKEDAQRNNRTLNAEIVARLESSYDSSLSESAQVQQAKREALLRLRIDQLTVQGAALAQGLLRIEEVLAEGGELTAEERHALDELLVDAKEMIKELWRSSPEAAIQDLQAAVARAQALEKLAQPKAAAKGRAKR